MPKHFSHLKDMTTHQTNSKEGKNLTEFEHYVGPFGKNEKMQIANNGDDNASKAKAKGY